MSKDKLQGLETLFKSEEKVNSFKSLSLLIKDLETLRPGSMERDETLSFDDKLLFRQKLLTRLEEWEAILKSSQTIDESISKSEQRLGENSERIKRNLNSIFKESKPLEETYRSLALFFTNTGKQRIANLTVCDSNQEMLGDFQDPNGPFTKVSEEIKNEFLTLDKRNCYSFLVIPKLNDSSKISKWGTMCKENGVILLTDREVRNKNGFENVNDMRHPNLSHTVCFTNKILARPGGKYSADPLYINPSMTIAGMIYKLDPISQGVNGSNFGLMSGIEAIEIPQTNNEEVVTDLRNKGLIPIVLYDKQAVVWGDSTMSNSDDPTSTSYPVVRVDEFLRKTTLAFANNLFGSQINANLLIDAQHALQRYLDTLRDSKIIKDSGSVSIRVDEANPKKVLINISYTPLFSIETIKINLTPEFKYAKVD